VVVLARGSVVAEGTPDQIGGRRPALITFRRPPGEPPLPEGALVEHDRVHLSTGEPTRALAPLISWADARDVELDELSITRPNLEDVYLELTREAA
jgi:ABC-2 type transport system ATP-binding protein